MPLVTDTLIRSVVPSLTDSGEAVAVVVQVSVS
jgi:hypothetical protein